MVRVLGPTGYKVVARLTAPDSGLPSDRYPDRVKLAGARRNGSWRRNGLPNQTKNLTKTKDLLPWQTLDKESSIQGPCAESEEKHEPASDADAAVVDSLNALDPNVWTRRALQGKIVRLESMVSHQCIRPRIGAVLRAIMEIRAHPSSLPAMPRRAIWGHQFSDVLEKTICPSTLFSRKTSVGRSKGRLHRVTRCCERLIATVLVVLATPLDSSA